MKNEYEALRMLIDYPGSGGATAARGASHDVIDAMLLDHHGLLERGYRAALCEWEAKNDETRVES